MVETGLVALQGDVGLYFDKITANIMTPKCSLQYENLTSIPRLPGKKTFNNMDRDFLEKRKKDLNAYLQVRAPTHSHLCV